MAQVSQEHLDFIPKIYETIVDPERWPSVLQQFANYCGAAEAQLALGDCLDHDIFLRPRSFSCSPEIVQKIDEFATKHHDEAKAFEVVSRFPVQTWVSEEIGFGAPLDQLPLVSLTRRLLGVERASCLRLNSTPIWFDGLTLHFKTGRGNITGQEISTSKIFVPHIAKAVEMSRTFLLLKARFKAIMSALDRVQIGILVTTKRVDVVACNRAAEELLSQENGLSLTPNGKLCARSGKSQVALEKQVFAASSTKHPASFEAVVSLPRRVGELPFLLEIFPLGNFVDDFDQRFNGAAIFIIDPDRKEIVSTKGMKELYGLTTAENSVLELLSDGYRAADIAEERNTTLHTIRSQVKSLLQKTTTSSQVDLLRLALRVNLPVERKK